MEHPSGTSDDSTESWTFTISGSIYRHHSRVLIPDVYISTFLPTFVFQLLEKYQLQTSSLWLARHLTDWYSTQQRSSSNIESFFSRITLTPYLIVSLPPTAFSQTQSDRPKDSLSKQNCQHLPPICLFQRFSSISCFAACKSILCAMVKATAHPHKAQTPYTVQICISWTFPVGQAPIKQRSRFCGGSKRPRHFQIQSEILAMLLLSPVSLVTNQCQSPMIKLAEAFWQG